MSSSTAALISSDCGVSSLYIDSFSKSKSSKLVLIVLLRAKLTISLMSSEVIVGNFTYFPSYENNPPFFVPVRNVSTATFGRQYYFLKLVLERNQISNQLFYLGVLVKTVSAVTILFILLSPI
jgi:hypothetical protein